MMEGDSEKNNIMPTPTAHRSASGDQLVEGAAAVRVPKPRKVFTMSSNNLLTLAKESVLQLEQELRDASPATEVEEDLGEDLDSSDESVGSCATVKKKSHHGSMENLFKPKNHRSTSRFSDPRPKRSNGYCNLDGEREMAVKLTEENLLLLGDLEKSRRRALGLKTCAFFSLAAFRGQKKKALEAGQQKNKKTEEAAARMILHTLLLNSWRKCKTELTTLTDDNAHLNKTMENLSLQLRVVRHIQSLDKEKMHEKNAELERMRVEMKRLEDDNEKTRGSMEKIEGELNSLQANIQCLQDANKLCQEEGQELKETIKVLQETVEQERLKACKLDRTNLLLKQDKRRAEDQLIEFTRQNTHWQEKARTYESELWALKMDLDGKEAQIQDIRNLCDILRKEKTDLIRSKSGMKAELKDMLNKREQLVQDKEDLHKKLEQTKFQVQEQMKLVEEAHISLLNARKDYARLEKELMGYKLKNVRRRREWANALYFIFNPIDAFRRSLVQLNNTQRSFNHLTH